MDWRRLSYVLRRALSCVCIIRTAPPPRKPPYDGVWVWCRAAPCMPDDFSGVHHIPAKQAYSPFFVCNHHIKLRGCVRRSAQQIITVHLRRIPCPSVCSRSNPFQQHAPTFDKSKSCGFTKSETPLVTDSPAHLQNHTANLGIPTVCGIQSAVRRASGCILPAKKDKLYPVSIHGHILISVLRHLRCQLLIAGL